MAWGNVGRFVLGIAFFVITAPWILLSAVVFLVVGPVLWVPLVVRSLFAYAIMLLLHAIIGRRMQASTAALEASISWYLASIPKILSHLADPFRIRIEEPVESGSAVSRGLGDKYNPLKAEFWEGFFGAVALLIRQSAWAAVFWAGVIFGLVHYGNASVKGFIARQASTTADIVSAIATVSREFEHTNAAEPGPETFSDTTPHALSTETWKSTSRLSPPVSIGKVHDCSNDYPPVSLRLGQQGITILSYHITVSGHVVHIRIAQSSGSMYLDGAAIQCVWRWRYTPAHRGTRNYAIPATAQIRWVLH